RRGGVRREPVGLAARAHAPRVLSRRPHGLFDRGHAEGDDRRPARASHRDGAVRYLVAALLLVAAAAACAEERLSVVSNGEVVGWVAAVQDGATVEVDYHVDNNGRGPKHRETIVLGAGGIPLAWRIEGTSLMGGPVEETWRYEHGRARWHSQADAGEVAADTAPLYVVNDGSPWALGIYARALLAAPSHELPVLPAGTLTLEAVRELTLG